MAFSTQGEKKKKSLKIHSFSIHGEFFYLHLQRTLQTYSQKESKLYLLSSLEETSIFISLISFFFFSYLYWESCFSWNCNMSLSCILGESRDAAILPIPVKAIETLNPHRWFIPKTRPYTASFPRGCRGRQLTWRRSNRSKGYEFLIPKSSVLN